MNAVATGARRSRPNHLHPVLQHAAPQQSMTARAARLYPENQYLQREWLRAIGVVRCTRRGWLLDHPTTKETHQ